MNGVWNPYYLAKKKGGSAMNLSTWWVADISIFAGQVGEGKPHLLKQLAGDIVLPYGVTLYKVSNRLRIH